MRYGFTTGSCSAAAAKAAAYMLLTGNIKDRIIISTPSGKSFDAEILDIKRSSREVSCGVVKDGGDDPDVTTGSIVYAKVAYSEEEGSIITIDGGEGVGRVTKPGLDQPVGNAAINSVPRQMIEKEVREVMDALDFDGSLSVIISIPGGEQIAEKTFNPRLGVEGGLSILGTSGIVEPMSSQALLDTIRVELRQKKALGIEKIVVAPGNYGMDFMRETYGYDMNDAVKCSNYIGETLDMIAEFGFKDALLCGHIGKLIKVSGGIMNTHSKEADSRMELMAAAGIRAGLSTDVLSQILECVSTDAAYEVILSTGKQKAVMQEVISKVDYYLKKRVNGRYNIECLIFSNVYGLMGMTEGAERLIYGNR